MTARTYEARRYERSGLLAIDPKAFLELFVSTPPERENREIENVATIVDVRGPLDHHDEGWCDSYEAISARVLAACGAQPPAVILRIDSPGGDAQGCFETARALRKCCAEHGKQLYAYIDGRACSAAYALASAASAIVLADSATVGSIGVLSTRSDYSAANASIGIRVAFIASGARKADGHPDLALSDAELASEQQLVDSIADVFFQLCADHRGGNKERFAALEARVLHGKSALAAGLADAITSFDDLLAMVASGAAKGLNMTALEQALAALREAAAGEGEDAARAAAALAALTAEDKSDEDKDKDCAEDKDKDKDCAEDGDSDEDDKDKEAASASASASDSVALQALARVHKLEAELARRDAMAEKERLIASRDDFAPEMIAALRKAPLKTVREMVATLPRGKAQRTAAAASGQTIPGLRASDTPTRAPTRGTDDSTPAIPATEQDDMNRRMGLTELSAGVEESAFKLTLGKVTPKRDASDVAAKGNS